VADWPACQSGGMTCDIKSFILLSFTAINLEQWHRGSEIDLFLQHQRMARLVTLTRHAEWDLI
jgi:hypothetical protein